MNIPKYNHNLSKAHNMALLDASKVATEFFKGRKFDSYDEAKKESVNTCINGYNFSLWPAYRDMIEGKDYGEDSPSAITVDAILVG